MSLVLSGALTWLLVSGLEVTNAKEQLDRNALVYAPAVERRECQVPAVSGNLCQAGKVNTAAAYTDQLVQLSESLAGDRLLLLDRDRQVVFDSQNQAALGQSIAAGRTAPRRLSGEEVQQTQFTTRGESFLGAAARVKTCPAGAQAGRPPVCRNPIRASYVVLARPEGTVAARASEELVPLLLEAGLAALALALLVTLLLSRALTRPLRELQSGAEDIAAGNYSRRVRVRGANEVGVVGTAFNRMAEAVERARKVERDFLANVSHELKTPLTSLIGFSQALIDGSLETDAEKTRAAAILHYEAQRVLRMSQELLDLARVESGQLPFRPQPVDLGAELRQEMELVRQRAEARGLVLRATVPTTLPPLQADPERLHQILDNLLDNAVKYAPEGSQVEIVAEAVGASIRTEVRNPVGVHAPDPERMFERFYRADPSRSSAAGGVGLGLAISRQLAAGQGGHLSAEISAGTLVMRLELPALDRAGGADDPVAATLRLHPRT